MSDKKTGNHLARNAVLLAFNAVAPVALGLGITDHSIALGIIGGICSAFLVYANTTNLQPPMVAYNAIFLISGLAFGHYTEFQPS